MVMLPPVQEPPEYNDNYVLYWNHAALELNRLTHSIGGPQTGPTISSRALGILHLAIHDAYFAIHPAASFSTYLDAAASQPEYQLPDPAGATDARQAVAGAAITVLEGFYARRNVGSNFSFDTGDQLDQLLRHHVAGFGGLDALSSSYQFGVDVGTAMLSLLAIKPDEPGADQGSYRPQPGRFRFRDEPSNPVRLVPVDPSQPNGAKRAAHIYHAPFYGMTAMRLAVQMTEDGTPGGTPTEHLVADPPVGFGTSDVVEYNDAVRDVTAMGGAPNLSSCRRQADQTCGGYFWAYDGANLIGTPPRLYNQILRRIAWDQTPPGATTEEKTAEFARLFALVNAAMADAGILCWREKYCFEFWRPLSGVREHDEATGPAYPGQPAHQKLAPLADPFWLALGAPETNTDRVSFKPPFPAYPSGHATFGAAAFQIVRLFYRERDGLSFAPDEPDSIGFTFVSEELNGVSCDLRQPYDPSRPITDQPGVVRTRVVREFPSLWAAIFENAISRIWLGVHWRFDAFAAKDVLVEDSTSSESPYEIGEDGTTTYQGVNDIKYETRGPRADRPGGSFPIGGVPLGLGIANDVFGGGLKPTPPDKQPLGRNKCGNDDVVGTGAAAKVSRRRVAVTPKASQTNIR
jgi:vanadium chloroperoxidase